MNEQRRFSLLGDLISLKSKFVIWLALLQKNRAFSEKLKLKLKSLTQATEIRFRMFDFKRT